MHEHKTAKLYSGKIVCRSYLQNFIERYIREIHLDTVLRTPTLPEGISGQCCSPAKTCPSPLVMQGSLWRHMPNIWTPAFKRQLQPSYATRKTPGTKYTDILKVSPPLMLFLPLLGWIQKGKMPIAKTIKLRQQRQGASNPYKTPDWKLSVSTKVHRKETSAWSPFNKVWWFAWSCLHL